MDTMLAFQGVAERQYHHSDVITSEAHPAPKSHTITDEESRFFVTSDYWLINFSRSIAYHYHQDDGATSLANIKEHLGDKFQTTLAKAAALAQEPVPKKPAQQFALLQKVAQPMIDFYASEYNIQTKLGMAHPMRPAHG